MIVDTQLQAFSIPQEKRVSFAELREAILSCKSTTSMKSLQRLMGKCSSFSLAFPGAKFYIREMAAAIGKTSRGSEAILTPNFRNEIGLIIAMSKGDRKTASRGSMDAVLFPSKDGFKLGGLQTDLWVFRIGPR